MPLTGAGQMKAPFIFAVLGGALELGDAELDLSDGDVGDGEELVRVVFAEVYEPAIVGPAVGVGYLGVFALGFPAQAERGEKKGLVDALVGEVLDPFIGEGSAGSDDCGLRVREGGVLHHPVPVLRDSGDTAESAAIVAAAHLAVDVQVFETELI